MQRIRSRFYNMVLEHLIIIINVPFFKEKGKYFWLYTFFYNIPIYIVFG